MAEIFASNRFFASTSPQACQIRAWLLPLCVAVCTQASAVSVENQLIGRPASQSFDVRLDVAPEFFAVAKDAAGAVIVGGAEGLMINSGENWTRLPLPNSQLVRRLLSEGKRTFVGGYNSFGYVEPDQFGQYRYHELANAKLSQQTNGFADIWDLHRSDRGVFFRALREVFLVEHEALAAAKFDPMKIKSWLHEGRFGQIGADSEGQTLLQFRGEGLRRLVNEA